MIVAELIFSERKSFLGKKQCFQIFALLKVGLPLLLCFLQLRRLGESHRRRADERPQQQQDERYAFHGPPAKARPSVS